jgi:pimeloyl-ACP methyl ester carboxylesterase
MKKFIKRSLAVLAIGVLALVIGISLLGALYRPDLSIPAGFKGQQVTVLGNPIRYYQQGSGPDILLIHGSPGSVEDWDTVIDELAKDYRVTAYDRPGHGYSGSAGNLHTYEYHADVALGLIEALELHDVLVVGHSYGGTTALAIALRKSAAVRGIVVLDSAGYRPRDTPSGLYRLLAIPGFGTGFARMIGPNLAPRKIREGLVAQFPGNAPPAGFIETRIGIWNQPKVTTTVAHEALLATAQMAAMSPGYKDIACPTFIAAQADNSFRQETAEQLEREIPGCELLLLSDTGHYVHVEKAVEVIDWIRKAAGPPANVPSTDPAPSPAEPAPQPAE